MKSLVTALFLSLIAVSAQAATLTVNTTQQCGVLCTTDGDGKCSFGEAIFTINQGADTKDCLDSASEAYGDNDTIHLPNGATLEFQHRDHTSTFIGPTALPVIETSVTIRGHGAKLIRQEDPETQPMRFFEIASQVDNEDSDFNDPSGPQIQVYWDETTFEGGSPDCFCPDNIPIAKDAIDTASVRAVSFCATSSNNICYSGGAGYIRGSGIFATFDKTTFKNNQVRTKAYLSPLGGAVFIDSGAFGMVNFSRSLFLGNKAPAGGAIYSGVGTQLSISESTFAGNKAQVERDISNDDDFDPDPVVDALDTADSKMGGAVYAEGPISSINDSAFYANQAGVGGALALRGTSTSILNSTFFKNSAELFGGSIAAALIPFNYRDLNGPQIANSASSFSQFATEALSRFGTSPTVTIEHATIVENTVGDGSLEVSAVSAGGGIANLGAATFSLKNTILTDNAAVGGASGFNCYGAFVSLGHNDLHWPAADPSCVVTHDAAADPDLSADPVLTACNEDKTTPGQASCDPEPTSPMIGAAASCPVEDQHHKARSADQCTVGAIEVDPPSPPTVSEGSVCGNGTVEGDEECDDGENLNDDTLPNACREKCRNPSCGDGVIDDELGEGCEGGVACFECTAEVVPSEGCGITAEQLLDPTLKTNDDLVDRYTYPVVAKCLQVFGGGNCSLNPGSKADASPFVFLLLGIAGLILPFSRRFGLSCRS